MAGSPILVTGKHLQAVQALGLGQDPEVFVRNQSLPVTTQLSIVDSASFQIHVDNVGGWETPVTSTPVGNRLTEDMRLAWVDSSDWARTHAGDCIKLHRIGTLRNLIPLYEDLQTQRVVVLGEFESLPKHAEMNRYDIGDRVLITSGPYQGPRVFEVDGVNSDGMFYGLAGSSRIGSRSVRATCLGAALDKGWQPTVPGHLRYPVGTQLRIPGVRGADQHLMVMDWRNGRAQVVNIDNDERHWMTKTAIADAMAADAAARPVS